jgi:Bacterial membrane protein YfhO
LLIAALGFLYFAKLVIHPSWVLYTDYSDLLTYQVPQMRYLVSSWQQTGEQPLWCPYSFAGMPFVHDLQVGAFYPPHLVLYALPAELIGPALSWLVLAHVIIAGWTMFAYARTQGLNQTCAMVAALGYMFSGKWLLHLVQAGQYVAVGLAWLPLVLLLLERSVRGGGLRFATGAGAVLALVVLVSHPQLTFYAGLLILVWTLPVALEKADIPGSGRRSWHTIAIAVARWLGAVGWCCLVAVALAAVQLLPTLEAGRQTTRGATGMPADILKVLLFNLFGLVGPAPASLPVTGWENRTGLTVFWIATALLAPYVYRGKTRLRLQTLICLGLIVFGLGGAFVFQRLPGFRLFRHPSRMLLLAALPVTLLVGTVTQAIFDLLRSEPELLRTMGRRVVLILLIGLVSTGMLCWFGGPPLGVPLFMYWGSLLATLPIACWLLRSAGLTGSRWPRWTASRFELAWSALLVADLWAMVWPLVDARPQAPIYAPSPCIRFLIERGTDHDRILDREVPEHGERSPLGLALPLVFRLEQLRGYNPIDIHRYKEYIQFISDRDEPLEPANGIINFPIVNKSLLDLLAVRYLVQPSDLPAMAGEPLDIAQDSRWQTINVDPEPETRQFVAGGRQQLPPFTVYENRETFPRAFVVPRAEPLPERSRVLAALRQADLRDVVFLEDFAPPRGPPVNSGRSGRAMISSYEPNHVVVVLDSDSPGYLVLADPWYPGWTCTVDDEPTRLYRANYAFRAAAVPAGKHRVRFDFDPISYRRGRVISAASLAALATLGVVAILLRLSRRAGNPLPASQLQPGNAHREMTE